MPGTDVGTCLANLKSSKKIIVAEVIWERKRMVRHEVGSALVLLSRKKRKK